MECIIADVQTNREERFQVYCTGNRIHNSSADFPNMLLLPNNLVDFVNNGTSEEMTSVGGKHLLSGMGPHLE